MNGTALLPSVTELRPDASVPLIIPTAPEEVLATHNAVPPHSVDEECTDRRPSVTATALYLWGSVLTALTYSDTGGTTGEELKPPDRYCPHCSKPKPPSGQRNATHCNFHQPLVRAFPGLDHYSFPNPLVCSNCPNSCTVRYPDRHNMPSHTPETELSNGLELKASICADTSLSRLKTFIVPG